VNCREIALLAEDAGIDGLFIHGRTKSQGYSGEVDYQAIAQVKKTLKIPVIASGNVFSAALIKKMQDETGCDGIAVARGALGNPWIFSGKLPDKEEVIRVMLWHLKSCIDFYGERNGVMIFRKFFCWYTRGFRKIRHLRERSSRAKTLAQMREMIEGCR
jgi:tRNA-dihydrouridine synthase